MSLKYRIRNFVRKHIPESLVMRYKLAHSTQYPIVKKLLDYFELVYHIKDDTWEPLHMPEIYQMSKPYDLEVFHGKQDILLIPNAQVSDNSDIVITEHGVVWDKYYSAIFSKVIPSDSNYVSHDINYIYVRNADCQIKVEGRCLSLMGAWELLWSHFIVQFYPKLIYAEEAGLFNKPITIIMPAYKDKQIIELINNVIEKHPSVKVLMHAQTNSRVCYRCDELIYIPTASQLTNNTTFETFYDSIIPTRVRDVLVSTIVEPYKHRSVSNGHNCSDKIFLIRRAQYRTLSNWKEVEDFFVSEGFSLLDPGTISLEEKASVFGHAKFIAGQASSAWSNIIFCNKPKALLLNVVGRVTDSYSRFLMDIGKVHTLMVTGVDETNNIQSNYYIPLDKIKAAYKQLMEE